MINCLVSSPCSSREPKISYFLLYLFCCLYDRYNQPASPAQAAPPSKRKKVEMKEEEEEDREEEIATQSSKRERAKLGNLVRCLHLHCLCRLRRQPALPSNIQSPMRLSSCLNARSVIRLCKRTLSVLLVRLSKSFGAPMATYMYVIYADKLRIQRRLHPT